VAAALPAEPVIEANEVAVAPAAVEEPPPSVAPRSVPPITNPPPAELAGLALAGPASPPLAEPVFPAAPEVAPPPASIPPPPITPVFYPPASLAPTAHDWNEFGSPSFLDTMKRTRPTSAWTGVGLFVAALTFAGGIGIGRGMRTPSLPPVPVPPPLVTDVAAAAPAPAPTAPPADAPASTPAAPSTPAPSKPLPPFDTKAARTALDAAAEKAKACRAAHEPKGTIATTVTFLPSGQVSSVAINTARYASTKTGKCVVERLSETRAPEFAGFPAALKSKVAVR
jgi:hypothetical protein